MRLDAVEVVGGVGEGDLLHADIGLSFWGGVDPLDGTVIDHTHPLYRQCISGKVLAIPNGRGSCTGSQVVLELILNGKAPAAFILRQPDVILALGVIVAEELFGLSIPIVSVGEEGFDEIAKAKYVAVEGASIRGGASCEEIQADAPSTPTFSSPDDLLEASTLVLTDAEKSMLDGEAGGHSQAMGVAMRTIARAAAIYESPHLLKITQAHIDGCTYIGPGGLRFAETLVELGGEVAVPTTLNSISVDRRRWKMFGVDESLGVPAHAVGDAYLALGAKHSFTCAPYLLDSAPTLGDQVAWGESNAVVFANSVLGARTQKYADYLDICAAITGRVPAAGPHLDAQRIATVILDASPLIESGLFETLGDAFFPTLGYLCGNMAGARVPVVTGLEAVKDRVKRDDLKAFSAAFGTSGAAALFHIAGITPEALDISDALGGASAESMETVSLTQGDLAVAWRSLDSGASEKSVELVAVGNPHLSLSECELIAELIQSDSEPKHPDVRFVATMGRHIFAEAEAAGHTKVMEDFGVQFVNDTCWCMLTEPVIPPDSTTLITNSGKYAHYAPGLVNRKVRFSNMAGCILAARTGKAPATPVWLGGSRSFSTARSFHLGAATSAMRSHLRRALRLIR